MFSFVLYFSCLFWLYGNLCGSIPISHFYKICYLNFDRECIECINSLELYEHFDNSNFLRHEHGVSFHLFAPSSISYSFDCIHWQVTGMALFQWGIQLYSVVEWDWTTCSVFGSAAG